MTESSTSREGSALGRAVRKVTPTKSFQHVLGVVAMVAAALGTVIFVGLSIISSRTDYYQQRNLRELDRIAAELTSTGTGLAQTATLHFVPQQLHFSLSSQLECLAATTEIMGARQQPMLITYYFTDTEATRQIATWYAEQTPRNPPAASRRPPQVRRRDLPPDICGYQRPLGLSTGGTRVLLGNGQFRMELTAPLRALLWPMSTARRPDSGELSACTDEPADSPGPSPTDLRSFISRCIFLAAMEDMADLTYSYRRPEQIPRVIRQSIEAALQSNTIRINVATPITALDFDSALEHFDALQIVGSDRDHSDRPILLHQAGRVPAAQEGDEEDRARFAAALAELAGNSASRPAGTSGAQRGARPGREGDFLGESRIVRTDDLILFQRTVPSLAGLYCNPCRIVGVVERSKFNQRVRRIDGVHATIFLIAILSLIGLIPLLQLRLRRRLDAAGRISQYITWFSLTLLAASTSIAGLAGWASAASRNAGAEYSGLQIRNIAAAFDAELRESLQLVTRIAAQLPVSPTTFPSPRTLPTRDQLNRDSDSGQPGPGEQAVAILAGAWSSNPAPAILDTVSYYRRDGYLDRRMARVAATRFPAFGTALSDRAYFSRAKNRDFDTIALAQCENAQFVIDRVFSRPDGAPRVVWVMPAKRDCRRSSVTETAAAAAPSSASPPDAATAEQLSNPAQFGPAPVFREDTGPFYDPTGTEFVVASGSLRTFFGRSLQPGFHYAIIDPDRPADEANVLFHSNPRAELVERFEREIDDQSEFRAIVRQAVASHPGENTSEDPQVLARLRMDTNYRAQPARLTVARLHPSMDWLLVIIEDRDDASYSIWRAATFGYAVWLLGALIAALALFSYAALKRDGLDRRPGLSLWPHRRLDIFTPPRLQRHAETRAAIGEAAKRRDRHIWWVLIAGIVGITCAEGASRIILAFAAALATFAARSYFHGLTATEESFAKRMDRWTIGIAAALLLLTIVVFADAIWADFHFRAYEARALDLDWIVKGRSVLVLAAVGAIGRCLYAAWAHIEDVPAPADAADGWFKKAWQRLGRWAPGRPRTDIGWMAALFIIGGLPAAAGFLDSYDQDRVLHFERKEQLVQQGVEERRQAINSINIGRLLKLPEQFVEAMTRGSPDRVPANPVPRPDADRCRTLSCLAIFYLDLHEDALEFSDSVSFHMLDALKTRGVSQWASLPFLIFLPLLALFLVLAYFHRQYFNPPPLLSPGKDPDFDPPLSFTRKHFIAKALLPAARGEAPTLPFKPAGGNRHLILGIGLQLRDEWAEGRRLADVEGIEWIDLLDLPDPPEAANGAEKPGTGEPAAADTAPAKVVVIGNLDLALQVKDEGRTADKAFRAIKAIPDAAAPGQAEHHVFLLADIDPLDRIALLWELQDETTSLTKGWRWAELIEDFTLFPIQHEDRIETGPANESRVVRTIREELGVLEVGFARELRDRLVSRFQRAGHSGGEPADAGFIDAESASAVPADAVPADAEPADAEPVTQAEKIERERARAERIVSFISEQMSDYYQKLWASSSDEERVVLYRIARDCHLKMPESRAIRSLLARGLIIRVPEYRLLNRSFTRYVCRIGASSRIQRAADDVGGLDHIWPLIRYPLAALAAAAVVLLQLLAPSAPSGAAGLLPALLALVPALLGRWFHDRAGAT